MKYRHVPAITWPVATLQIKLLFANLVPFIEMLITASELMDARVIDDVLFIPLTFQSAKHSPGISDNENRKTGEIKFILYKFPCW